MRLACLAVLGLGGWLCSAGSLELYDRLELAKTATATEIRRAYHQKARHAHPDKVDGDQAAKEAAAEKFKRLAEAYEVLMDKGMRADYDRSGRIPDDKAKNAANQQSTGEEDDFGFEQKPSPPPRGGHWGRGFESYDAFEVRLAQGRARRARSMEQLRRHLFAPNGTAIRYGLVGFYRAGEEGTLKERLKFPYPFAGWSLGREGSGFWWEDELQTFLVPLGQSTNELSELSKHFGLSHSSQLPAVAWVRKEAAMGFELARPASSRDLVDWVYQRLSSTIRIVNHDHRPAKVWWLDGHSAKPMGTANAHGGVFSHSSFVSHSWFCWAESTEGRVLGRGAALGELTVSRVGQEHVLELWPRCVDANGHCGQWQQKGECERNPGYMDAQCPRSCGQCEGWDWLYELRLGSLHQPLACWANPSSRGGEPCVALERRLGASWRWPAGEREWSARAQACAADAKRSCIAELRGLPRETRAWLKAAAGPESARAFDEAMLPPRPQPPPPLPPKPPPRVPLPRPPPVRKTDTDGKSEL